MINAEGVPAQPCTLQIRLDVETSAAGGEADGGGGRAVVEIGAASCELRQARGFIEVGLQGGDAGGGSAPRVAFYYEVGAWLD